jgi:hypothetical protein
VERAAWMGARATQVRGDCEGLPNRKELIAADITSENYSDKKAEARKIVNEFVRNNTDNDVIKELMDITTGMDSDSNNMLDDDKMLKLLTSNNGGRKKSQKRKQRR